MLALNGWYRETRQAVQGLKVEQASCYLRLFYAEEFLGWQSQRALEHTIAAESAVSSWDHGPLTRSRTYTRVKKHTTENDSVIAVTTMITPLLSVSVIVTRGELGAESDMLAVDGVRRKAQPQKRPRPRRTGRMVESQG